MGSWMNFMVVKAGMPWFSAPSGDTQSVLPVLNFGIEGHGTSQPSFPYSKCPQASLGSPWQARLLLSMPYWRATRVAKAQRSALDFPDSFIETSNDSIPLGKSLLV